MATYDHKQVLADYANGTLTPEMAVGHSLQHIDKLYTAQTDATRQWRAELDALKQQVHTQQARLDRLHTLIEKARTKQKLRTPATPSTPDQG
ncbi:MAG: hypothetical protein DYG89_46460 [Caldilinea sp. CFX5]|nr:hypothetical protein [Caldilinea sp. CFX5]